MIDPEDVIIINKEFNMTYDFDRINTLMNRVLSNDGRYDLEAIKDELKEQFVTEGTLNTEAIKRVATDSKLEFGSDYLFDYPIFSHDKKNVHFLMYRQGKCMINLDLGVEYRKI